MVRAGVLSHPAEWRWCGYDEPTGRRRRHRPLDLECVLKWRPGMTAEGFARAYEASIAESITRRELARDPVWTESIAVGAEAFVEAVTGGLSNRKRHYRKEVAEGVRVVRERPSPYSAFSGAKTPPKGLLSPQEIT
jgi:putative transposase